MVGVHFEADGAVGRIVLERPEAANSFDLPAARAFGAAVAQSEATACPRGLVDREGAAILRGRRRGVLRSGR